VKFNDEVRTERIRSAGRRLAATTWRVFSRLEVTPYVDGTPAGAPSFPRVLWREADLYVTSTVSVAKLHRDLADELSSPFEDRSVAEAITACIDRTSDYISEYFADQFELEDRVESADTGAEPTDSGRATQGSDEPDSKSSGETVSAPATDSTAVPADTDEGTPVEVDREGDTEDDPDASQPSKQPAPHEPTLIEAYAKQRGFRWVALTNRYTHEDGRWIEKAKSPFNWIEHLADGTAATRIWVSDQRLASGIEVAAELWGLASREPASTAIIMHGDNHVPCFLSGQSLLRLKDEQKIVILPSRYRIVESP
jgi:hypothetical protein